MSENRPSVAEDQIVLIQIDGRDAPGITTQVFGAIADADATVLDVDQTVIHGHISLNIVTTIPAGQDLLKDLLYVGWQWGLRVEFEPVDTEPERRPTGTIVTVLGRTITPMMLQEITGEVTSCGANVDRIERLSAYPAYSYQLTISGGDSQELRGALLRVRRRLPAIDIAIQPRGLPRRALRLVVLDVDRTLIQNEMIDEIAELAGVGEEVAAITAEAMAGGMDFETSLRKRVGLLAGAPVSVIDEAWERLRFTPGARTFLATLRHLGFRVAVVSGGFTAIVERLADELNIPHAYANTLEVADGVLTGDVVGQVVDRARKATLVSEIAAAEGLDVRQVVAVGDGANDIDMLETAGLGIAFNAKAVVGDAADAAVNVPYLDAILFLLGVRREDIESEGSLTRYVELDTEDEATG